MNALQSKHMTTHSASECKCIGFMSGKVVDTSLCELHRPKTTPALEVRRIEATPEPKTDSSRFNQCDSCGMMKNLVEGKAVCGLCDAL